jgi:hypothetical protein
MAKDKKDMKKGRSQQAKHQRCSNAKCGLKIRCGSVERHEEGLSHNIRIGRISVGTTRY